jgi:hypothetical protein
VIALDFLTADCALAAERPNVYSSDSREEFLSLRRSAMGLSAKPNIAPPPGASKFVWVPGSINIWFLRDQSAET